MKLDFVISNLGGGGAQRVLVLLANAFAKKGCEVTVLTFNPQEDYKLDQTINRVRLHRGRIPNHTIRSIFILAKHYRKKENRPDIILSFITLTNLISILVAKLYGIKIIGCEHNSHIRNTFRTDKFTKKYIYRFADAITVLTKFDVPFYQKYHAKVVVMPNPATFESIKNNNHERDKTILAVGALNRYKTKGFDQLMYILEPVFKKFPDWKLKILGKGDVQMNILKEIADELAITDHVEFMGFQKNVGEIMRKSGIFILPSRFEGLPMVLVEAMSQGMPCIAFDCITGPSDIIQDKVDGLLIENQNLEKMSLGIEELIAKPALRKKLSANAIKNVERYHIEKITAQWFKLFDEILKK